MAPFAGFSCKNVDRGYRNHVEIKALLLGFVCATYCDCGLNNNVPCFDVGGPTKYQQRFSVTNVHAHTFKKTSEVFNHPMGYHLHLLVETATFRMLINCLYVFVSFLIFQWDRYNPRDQLSVTWFLSCGSGWIWLGSPYQHLFWRSAPPWRCTQTFWPTRISGSSLAMARHHRRVCWLVCGGEQRHYQRPLLVNFVQLFFKLVCVLRLFQIP